MNKNMKKLMLIALASACIYLLFAGAIVIFGLSDKIDNADIIVVPGNAVKLDGSPSPRLKARLDVALELYRQRRAKVIYVSGGIEKNGSDESVIMASYLEKNKVPSGAIVKDNLGIDTFSTAKNAAAFMKTNNLKSAIIATQYFHIARTKLALERNGVAVTGYAHAHYFELRDFYSIAREVIGYFDYCFRSVN